jgi:hypothetical protein
MLEGRAPVYHCILAQATGGWRPMPICHSPFGLRRHGMRGRARRDAGAREGVTWRTE